MSAFKETPVPQLFLSSLSNKHRSDSDFGKLGALVENGVSRTLSRKFWQQKYFLENLLFERSPLATANFLGVFAKPIRKPIPVRAVLWKLRGKTSPPMSRRKMESG
jgi:hypothetical protein